MSDVMMKLGAFTFRVDTAAYQQLTRATEYRWPGQERIGQANALQYTGPGADTITLTGVVYPQFRGGLSQIEDMRTEAAKGQPLLLVDGRGRIHGRWVIERVEETQDAFFIAGAPKRQRFTLQLRKYDDGAAV
jgi:phage protein U